MFKHTKKLRKNNINIIDKLFILKLEIHSLMITLQMKNSNLELINKTLKYNLNQETIIETRNRVIFQLEKRFFKS